MQMPEFRDWGWLVSGLVTGAVGAAALGALLPAGSEAPLEALPAPRFSEVAAAAGIDHVYDGDFTYFVGGGVAAFDCDQDARPDLYLAGGEQPARLYRNTTPVGGDLRFAVVEAPDATLDGVTGAYPLDVDGDGLVDLAVLRNGENVLLRGRGDCGFEPAGAAWGFDGGDDWTVAFSATWEAGATWPTVAIGNYLDLSQGRDAATCDDNELVRPAADGAGFGPPATLAPGWCTLSVLFSDWDRSGRRDLRMANDRHYSRDGHEQLWRVAAGEPPELYDEADGWQRLRIWGMGLASHDLTGDGMPEVFITSQGDNKLQTLVADNGGRPTYEDIAIDSGATAHRPYAGGDVQPSTAWHPQFEDVNNDGFTDLLVTKGNVEAQEGYATRDPNNLLLGQPDGTFAEAGDAAGIVRFARSRGAAVVDLDQDGLLDLVVVNRGAPAEVWRNLGSGSAAAPAPMGHWLAVRLEQAAPNRDAVGAWLEVRADDRTWLRELTVGGGHASGQLGWLHVGLGPATDPEVRVVWPDGEVGPWQDAPVDGFAVVERGASRVRPWTPAASP